MAKMDLYSSGAASGGYGKLEPGGGGAAGAGRKGAVRQDQATMQKSEFVEQKYKTLRGTLPDLVTSRLDKDPEARARFVLDAPRRILGSAMTHLRRAYADLAQRSLATAIGKDQAHISRMESYSASDPSLASIASYAEGCNVVAGVVFAAYDSLADATRVVSAAPLQSYYLDKETGAAVDGEAVMQQLQVTVNEKAVRGDRVCDFSGFMAQALGTSSTERENLTVAFVDELVGSFEKAFDSAVPSQTKAKLLSDVRELLSGASGGAQAMVTSGVEVAAAAATRAGDDDPRAAAFDMGKKPG